MPMQLFLPIVHNPRELSGQGAVVLRFPTTLPIRIVRSAMTDSGQTTAVNTLNPITLATRVMDQRAFWDKKVN